MPRREWIAEGLVVEAPERAEAYKPQITEAWDCVINARAAFLRGDWVNTDRWSREACVTASKALVFSRGFEPSGDWPVRMARDYIFDTFGVMGDEVFTRAELVGEFLPMVLEVDESRHSLFEKTVAASSEMVALIECHIAVEKRPPEPRDPHVCYPPKRQYYY